MAGGGVPSSRIRVGVVGANPNRGWSTSAHLPALAQLPEYEITAVATTRKESARETAERFGVPLAFDSADGRVAAAIAEGRQPVPSFDTAVEYHGLLATIEAAAGTGTRQQVAPPPLLTS